MLYNQVKLSFQRRSRSLSESPTQTIDSSPCCKTGPSSGPPQMKMSGSAPDHQAGVNFENFTEVKFQDIMLTGTGHRDRRLNRDSPGQTYGNSNLNQNLKPKSNFRFIREKTFAIPSFDQKCRPPKSAAPGHCPALVGSLQSCPT